MSSAAAAYSGATSSCIAFVFLIFASCSPWTIYSPYLSYNGVYTSFGVGPFVAGASTGSFGYYPNQFYSGVVWWNDLTSANTCVAGSDIYEKWAGPNGLCVDGGFVIPLEVQSIQACIVLATIFAFLAGLAGCSMSKNKAAGGGATCFAFLGMIFAICAFAIWTTWGMSLKLQNKPGDYVPLYSTTDLGKTISVQPSPVKVYMYYGWTFVTTIMSFILLLGATVSFAGASKKAVDDGEFGEFGAGSGV